MKKRANAEQFFGILFLLIGILWISVIFIRCEVSIWRKPPPQISSESDQQQTEKQSQKDNRKRIFLDKHVPKMFKIQFKVIATLELFCALFFLTSGIAVLRRYPFNRQIVICTVSADIVLKTLIVTYDRCILKPIEAIFEGKNILFMYFSPDRGAISTLSSYLSGIKWIQPQAYYYGTFYVLFMLGIFYFFTRPRTDNF